MNQFSPLEKLALSTTQINSVEPFDTAVDQNVNDWKENLMVVDRHESKTTNTQSIHGNYAKRRYKNVESKVGRYIADFQAEERKKKAAKAVRSNSVPYSFKTPIKFAFEDSIDAEDCMSSSQGTASINSAFSYHESSDDAVDCTDLIVKQKYAQIVREKEHLENLLDEKRSECIRQRRNVDFLRIELANCQDELKRANTIATQLQLRYNTGFAGYNFGARARLETKATQTDESLGTPKRRTANENILNPRSNLFDDNVENDEKDDIYSQKLQHDAPLTSPKFALKVSPTRSEYKYYNRSQPYAPVLTKSFSADACTLQAHSQSHEEKHQRQLRHGRKSNFRQRFNRLFLFNRCTRNDPSSSPESVRSYPEYDIEMQPPLLARTEESQQIN